MAVVFRPKDLIGHTNSDFVAEIVSEEEFTRLYPRDRLEDSSWIGFEVLQDSGYPADIGRVFKGAAINYIKLSGFKNKLKGVL